MYEILLDKLEAEQGDPGTLHITTIGCGNMIDCWGFVDALGRLEKNKYNNKYKYKYIYHGIDLIDWGDLRVDNWMKRNGKFLPGSKSTDEDKYKYPNFIRADVAEEIRNEKEEMFADVYTFANSISELDEDLLRDFCGSISKNGKDRFFLLITIRDSSRENSNRDEDLGKVKLMVEELRQRGYDTEDDFENPVNQKGQIGKDHWFYPVINKKDALSDKLEQKLNESIPAKNKVHTQPILNADYLHYLVLSFKKKQDVLKKDF